MLHRGFTLHMGKEIFASWFSAGAACIVAGGAVFFGSDHAFRKVLDSHGPLSKTAWSWHDWLFTAYTVLGAVALIVATLLTQNRPHTEVFWMIGIFTVMTGAIMLLGRFVERFVSRLRNKE